MYILPFLVESLFVCDSILVMSSDWQNHGEGIYIDCEDSRVQYKYQHGGQTHMENTRLLALNKGCN